MITQSNEFVERLEKMDCKTSTVQIRGDIDAKANEILKRELKEKWVETTYDEVLQLDPSSFGFTSEYLYLSASAEHFSSSAKVSTLVELAKLDLQRKTVIAQLVFSCCKMFPKKQAIKSLIQLGRESDENVIERIFDFQNHQGQSCLTVIFDIATQYRNKNNNEYPSGPMLVDIEDSYKFLIQLVKSAELDLYTILNHTAKNGDTLFLRASMYSEKMTKQLLKETNAHKEKIVQVNSIDSRFMIPFFRVRLKIDFRR